MKFDRQRKNPPTSRLPRNFFLIFGLMALLSAAGLDLINGLRGQKSLLFSPRSPKSVETKPLSLEDIIGENIAVLNISPTSTRQFWDSEKNLHIMIDLDREDYQRLAASLEKALTDNRATILGKEEYNQENKTSYLWRIKGQGDQRISLMFSCPLKASSLKENLPDSAAVENRVAIIIDDMGYSMEAIDGVTQIGLPLTVAIIPFTPLGRETAALARKNGLEVILHLPMESRNEKEANKMEGIILSGMSDEEIRATLEKDLNDVPQARGANNHMGSQVTNDKSIMRTVLEDLKKHNLFFLDSLTTGDSVASAMAKNLGIPTVVRDVFLDGENNEAYIKRQLERLFELARRKSTAVGIGHPSEQTIKVLRENLLVMQTMFGVKLVFASDVVR